MRNYSRDEPTPIGLVTSRYALAALIIGLGLQAERGMTTQDGNTSEATGEC